MKDNVSRTAVIAYLHGVKDAAEEIGITIIDISNIITCMESFVKELPSDGDALHLPFQFPMNDWKKDVECSNEDSRN